jgi:hypothetical protein
MPGEGKNRKARDLIKEKEKEMKVSGKFCKDCLYIFKDLIYAFGAIKRY